MTQRQEVRGWNAALAFNVNRRNGLHVIFDRCIAHVVSISAARLFRLTIDDLTIPFHEIK